MCRRDSVPFPVRQVKRRARAAAAPVRTQILSVVPAAGDAGGGETVRITCNRLRATPVVTIGGQNAPVTGGSYGDAGAYVDVTVPAHAAGDEDVVVTDYHGVSTLVDGFEFVANNDPPTITSIDPATGLQAGGSEHTIIGTGFIEDATTVLFGAEEAEVEFISTTQLTVTAPVNAGTVDITVETANGEDTLEDGFEYIADDSDEPADPGSGYIWEDNFARYDQGSSNATILSMGRTSGSPPSSDSVWGRRTFPNSPNTDTPQYEFYQYVDDGEGGKAIQVTYPNSGSQQNHNFLTPWHAANNSANYLFNNPGGSAYVLGDELVVEYEAKITPGWSPGTAGIKWAEFWNNGGADRDQFSPNQGTDGRPLWHVEFSLSSGDVAYQTNGPYWDDVNDGGWHRFKYLLKANSTWAFPSASSRDGRYAMWIDGEKIIDISQATVGATEGPRCNQSDVDRIPNHRIAFLKLPDNLNGLNRGTGAIAIRKLKCWVI